MTSSAAPIGFWFCVVGCDGSPPIAPTARAARRFGEVANIYFGNLDYGYGYEDLFIGKTMNYEAASVSLDFEVAWSQLESTLRAHFSRVGVASTFGCESQNGQLPS